MHNQRRRAVKIDNLRRGQQRHTAAVSVCFTQEEITVAMARTNDPHSATCQFFINVADNDFLNFSSETGSGWGYCVFGEVTEGMDVIDSIKKVATGRAQGHSDVPVKPVIIEKAELHA